MEWYYVCWPWLTAKRVEPVSASAELFVHPSITNARCLTVMRPCYGMMPFFRPSVRPVWASRRRTKERKSKTKARGNFKFGGNTLRRSCNRNPNFRAERSHRPVAFSNPRQIVFAVPVQWRHVNCSLWLC